MEDVKDVNGGAAVDVVKEDSSFGDVEDEDLMLKPDAPPAPVVEKAEVKVEEQPAAVKTHIFVLRTTANREDQVVDFLGSNVQKKSILVYSIIRPHGMRGYVFIEAEARGDAEQAVFNVPYARGLLPQEVQYNEIEHMLEQVKKEINIQKGDIVELISGPFKREKAKISRIDKQKEEVVVELLEAAVPIPITVKMDAVKVIRRDTVDESGGKQRSETIHDEEEDLLM